MLVLANVAAPTAEQAEQLGRLVRGGHGTDDLHRGQARRRPLQRPAPPTGATGSCRCRLKSLVDETIRGLIVEPLRPSPLEKLLELKPSALERVAVRQIMTVDEPADKDQVRVLARWNNPAPVAGGGRAGRRRRARPALDDHRRPRRQRLADRAQLRPGGARGRARHGAADLA